jgi:hypothetical protein
MFLTSSRCRPDGPVDLLSDLAVNDVGPFAFDKNEILVCRCHPDIGK